MTTFLSPYLLSSQGDRMAMAHSVEGRYPFLDYRVIEFCNRLPPDMKMPVLVEKWLLKQLGAKYLPENIWQRRKRPYRAPINRSFFLSAPPAYVNELLAPDAIRQSGLFNPTAVAMLFNKARTASQSSYGLSEVEDMALVGILSTQLVHYQFVRGERSVRNVIRLDQVKLIDRVPVVR